MIHRLRTLENSTASIRPQVHEENGDGTLYQVAEMET